MALKKRGGPQSVKLTNKRSSQLWLSLLEDANKTEWPPTIEGQNWRVLLTDSESLQGCNHRGLYRTSPVFAATTDFCKPDLGSGTHYLNFFWMNIKFDQANKRRYSIRHENDEPVEKKTNHDGKGISRALRRR